MSRPMRNLRHDESGASLIELALVAPVLALATIGLVDISNAYSAKLSLEQGAQRAIEKIMQTTQDLPVNDSLVKEAVCQVNGFDLDGESGEEVCKDGLIANSDVTVGDRLECADPDGTVLVKTGDAALDDCAENQAETRYKSVAITAVYEPMFPIHFLGYNSADKGYRINATAGMRTK